MIRDLIIRFLLGGTIVSAFSLTGDLWKPKTFSGIFGAAPSVALASLALTFHQQGAGTVAVLSRSMVAGAVALFAYSAACVAGTKREHAPVWAVAVSAWLPWSIVAFGVLAAGARLEGLV